MHLKLSINCSVHWHVKPSANGCNIAGQQLPTLLDVGCYMLHPFAHPVADYWVLLGVVACSLKPVKFLAKCKWMQ